MFTRLHGRVGHYLVLAAMSGALFFVNLGGPSLWDVDEGRNLTCSYEMMESGNWIVPTFNGALRTDKPVLLYWLQIACYHACGVNEFAGRLPSAVAALATVLLGYELARSMFGRATGLLAGVVIAATPMICGAARFANPDALLNLSITLTMTVFWLGRGRPALWWFAALGASQGLGMLAKGPIALAVPTGILVVFLCGERRLRALWDLGWVATGLTFAAVAMPWYVWVAADTKGEWTEGFFFQHNVARYLSPMENHQAGAWYYPLVIAVGTAPWSIFLGPALWFAAWSAVRRPWPRCRAAWASAADRTDAGPAADRRAAAYRLLLSWGGVVLLFFSLAATKLPNYALPLVVPTAILLARFLDRWRRGVVGVPPWTVATALAGLALIGAVISLGLLAAGGAIPIDALRGRQIEGLAPWAALGLAPVAGAGAGLWCWRTGRRTGLVVSVAAAALLLLAPLAAYGVAALEGRKPARALVAQSGAYRPAEDIRILVWQADHLPSLNFYTARNITCCLTDDRVRYSLTYPLPVYVFMPASVWEELRPRLDAPARVVARVVARHPDLYRGEDAVVVTNR